MSDEIERIIVCCDADDSIYADNVHGQCAQCGRAIVWRPHNPEPSIKMCWHCVDVREGDEVEITEATRREVAWFLGKKN